MIPQHQGAIIMSWVVLDRGHDERVAAIARRIIADQRQKSMRRNDMPAVGN
jgi:uncharacterized protein (DUF305 family)